MKDTKRTLLLMFLALLLLVGWNYGITGLYHWMGWKTPQQEAQERKEQQEQQERDRLAAATQQSSTQPATGPTTQQLATAISATQPTTAPLQVAAVPSEAAQGALLGSTQAKDPTYVMGVKLSPLGGSIESVTLNDFKQTVDKPDLYTFQKPYDADVNATRVLGTTSITLDGQTIDLASAAWRLENSSSDAAIYVTEISRNGAPALRVRKIYQLPKRSDKETQGYEMTLRLAFENLAGAPLSLQTALNGPTAPPVEVYRGPDRQAVGAYDKGGSVALYHHTVEEFTTKSPTRDITVSEDSEHFKLVWAGMTGTYFNALMRPLSLIPGKPPEYVAKVEGRLVHFDEPSGIHDVQLTYQLAHRLDAGQTLELPLKVFFGPKQRSLLNNDYYSQPLIAYNATLVMTSGICGYCTFQWLIDLLVKLLIAFHWLFGGFARHGDWGLAIIGLVCLVRLILHPITKKSQVNMMKMGKLGPEMEKLKKKYGDDKEAMAKAQMGLYKEIGFTPVLGCLPMFLQMPIFIALWACLQSTFELRHAPFLWNMTWIHDLAQPDALIKFAHPISLGFFTLDSINLLPVLVAVVSYINMKMQPKPVAMTPEQEQQQKMMQWMTLIFPLMFYKMPAGLNLYYLSTTSIGIIEGKVIRDHIKQREEAEKAGKVIIDAAPSRRRKGAGALATAKSGEESPGCIGQLFGQLQERAEQLKRETERKSK
jgi:YidC/Oxa1 family membrane protein insertase